MCAHPQTCILNLYCLSVYLSTLSDPNNWKTNIQTKTCTCSRQLPSQQPKGENNTNIWQPMAEGTRCIYPDNRVLSNPTVMCWCADTSRSLPEWQETVTKDLVHHSTRQVCEEFFMEQQRTDRTSINFIIGSSCLRVSAMWELWRWTPGTLSRQGHLSSYLNSDHSSQSESWILLTKSRQKRKRSWEAILSQ